MIRRLRFDRRFHKHDDLVILAGALAVVLALTAFWWVAEAVTERDTQAIDVLILRALRNPDDPYDPHGPGWVEEMGRDFSALGGLGVLTLSTLAVSGYLWLVGKRRAVAWVVTAAALGGLLNEGLKALFARARPTVVPHLTEVSSPSFPSGHAMLSTIVYLTLGTLVAEQTPYWRVRLYVIGVALVLSFLVGVSRVYLGVHYPSDVLGGWVAGLTWSLCVWTVSRALQRRGLVD